MGFKSGFKGLKPSVLYNISSEKIIQNKKGRFDQAHLWLEFPQKSLAFIRPCTVGVLREKN